MTCVDERTISTVTGAELMTAKCSGSLPSRRLHRNKRKRKLKQGHSIRTENEIFFEFFNERNGGEGVSAFAVFVGKHQHLQYIDTCGDVVKETG